jgi:Putative transposase of IS4/5 family (DUF4096)
MELPRRPLPAPKATGRTRLYPQREILDAIFYVLRSVCAWRLLPHDLERRGRPSTTDLPLLARRWHLGEDARRPAQPPDGCGHQARGGEVRTSGRQPRPWCRPLAAIEEPPMSSLTLKILLDKKTDKKIVEESSGSFIVWNVPRDFEP